MPKDEWARANARKKFGPTSGPIYSKFKAPANKKKRKRAGPFTVPAGVPCFVRRAGGEWRPHTTKRDSIFELYNPADGGRWWVFYSDGWELKVSPKHARG